MLSVQVLWKERWKHTISIKKILHRMATNFTFFLLITLTYWVKSLSSLFKIILRVNEFDLLLNLELEKNISVEENWGKFKKKLVKYDNI